jgi:hypothetical protein
MSSNETELDKRLTALEAKVTAMQKDIDEMKRPRPRNWVTTPCVEEDPILDLFR